MERNLLKQVQEKQMQIMDEVHKICVNHNLRYYLIGGSCLGAIRHKGYIPWDVDIDIAMPREDYELFFTKYYKNLPAEYSIHTFETDEVFDKSHALVCLNNSVLLTKADIYDQTIPKYGIFIDVMPLDKCPSDKKMQQRHKRDYLFIKKLRKLKLIRIYKNNSSISKMIKHIIRFAFSPLSVSLINKWQQAVMMRYSNLEESEYWCSMASHFKYEKQLMDRNIYGIPTLAAFENREYYIPAQPDTYLKRLYGDYMKLPSREEQDRMYNYFEVAEWQE